MRIVNGFSKGAVELCTKRGLNLENLPHSVKISMNQIFGKSLSVSDVVGQIIMQVREEGDSAVKEITSKVDGSNLADLEVPQEILETAHSRITSDLKNALSTAADRVRKFHELSMPKNWENEDEGYGQIYTAVNRVGAYVPGGTALYPSTVLMSVIPAKVAGAEEVIMCTPTKGNLMPNDAVLAAAKISGVDRIFRIGGAQAIAAMAYGTETIPKVDTICGPGNLFVTLAKKLVYGDVGIDGLYGPTETLVIADDTSNATLCAADLLAQAEHDVMARPILITTSERFANAVSVEVETRLQNMDRKNIARPSIDEQGCIVIVTSMNEAMDLANQIAPEHMSLMMDEPEKYLTLVKNAGAVFIGDFSHEVLGDYVAGPSHIMPTAGTARFNSGLGVHSFLKVSPIIAISESTSKEITRAASIMGRTEGLTAHAEAAELREEFFNRP